MKTEVLGLREALDPESLVERAVRRLAEGAVVAIPTETVYGIAASLLQTGAVERIANIKGREPGKPFTLAVASHEAAFRVVPQVGALGRRLARRCWPGPVTLVFDSPACGIPESVSRFICPNGRVGFRVPAEEIALRCLRRLACPLVLTSANQSGQPPATTAEEVCRYLPDSLDVVLDGGPCRYGQSSTVVRVNNAHWEMVREGLVSEAVIQRLSRCMILFACTGNTCRSPMAEAICKKLLAAKLNCNAEDLPERGYEILSAGVSAIPGCAASAGAVTAMRERGVDINDHFSQAISAEMAYQADHIFAMTDTHLSLIQAMVPEAAERVRLIRRDGGSIADPVGLDIAAYRRSADEIEENLKLILSDLVP